MHQPFGKNRIQYREFNWLYYPYERFEVYHYRGGDKLSQYVALSADKSLKEVESFLDFTIPEKITIARVIREQLQLTSWYLTDSFLKYKQKASKI